MEALPHMHKLLESRPDGFASPEAAIEWQYVNYHDLTLPIVSIDAIISPLTGAFMP